MDGNLAIPVVVLPQLEQASLHLPPRLCARQTRDGRISSEHDADHQDEHENGGDHPRISRTPSNMSVGS